MVGEGKFKYAGNIRAAIELAESVDALDREADPCPRPVDARAARTHDADIND